MAPLDDLLAQLDTPLNEDLLRDVSSRNARAILIFGVGLGWRAHAQHNSLVLVAPDNTKVNLPQHGDLSYKAFRQKINTIVRHKGDTIVAPMSLVQMLIPALKLDADHASVLRKSLVVLTPAETAAVEDRSYADSGRTLDPDSGTVVITSRKPFSGSVYASVAEEALPHESGVSPVVGEAEPLPDLTLEIVRSEPWSAHGRPARGGVGSELYPSSAVIEREYRDGHKDYVCTWPGCARVSDNPRSIASHYGPAHIRGQGKQAPADADSVDLDWTPKQTVRIKRLKRELEGAFVAALAAGVDCTDAEWIAAWVIEHRIEPVGNGDTTESDTGPWTAEQILDKIAALADRGRAHVLREQVATLNELLDQSEADRKRTRDDLLATRDLINSIQIQP